jgi:hypothetical protein
MRIFLIAATVGALALSAVPSSAQVGGINGIGPSQGAGRAGGGSPQQTPEEIAKKKEEDKAREREFSDAVRRIPAPNKKYDPWGNIRN